VVLMQLGMWDGRTMSTSVFCDNESVVKNLTTLESTLKKRHNVIAYHHAQEAQEAAGIICAVLLRRPHKYRARARSSIE
jgi:hypothetical protein